ncbi:MAG: alpha-E domain-containing protein [Pseudomonadota bacterium]
MHQEQKTYPVRVRNKGMLGRAANDLFWLARYVERAENMARIIDVGYRLALLPRDGTGNHNEWRSTLESAGCLDGFLEQHDELQTREVVDYLLFDPENPSSIRSCLYQARQNARSQRTSMTREMWEALNLAWLEFAAYDRQHVTSDQLLQILDSVKQASAMWRGTMLNTVLRDDRFHFLQLGAFLERADNTARILDVKYYVLLPSLAAIGSGIDNFQWATVLRSVAGHRSYNHVYRAGYRPLNIAEFLILNDQMPRSLATCYGYITQSLYGLNELYGEETTCLQTASTTENLLRNGDIEAIFSTGLHEFLSDLIARNNRLGADISDAYHFETVRPG